MKQVEIAQNNQRLVLVMLGSVAMLTALFIILSTLSMGMVERVRQLGLLRCVGMTRGQLAGLVLIEVLPLGAVGVLAGLPLGLGLTALTVQLVPDYVGSFVLSWHGIGLAVGAGLATTLVAALLPALAMLRVSPMEAAHPRARRPRRILLIVVAGLAALLLVWQHYGVVAHTVRDVDFLVMAAVGVVLLYFGYALIAPPAVRLIGTPAVVIAARMLGVRTRLLQDQVGYAVWRSAGICCGLMVGLSLVVGIIVVNESVTSGWQFPKQFPAAFAWSYGQLSPRTPQRVAAVPGVGTFTVGNSINVIVEERNPLAEKLLLSVTWFLGVEPDSFFDLVKAEFLEGEGDEETARELLKRGGYVIIADDFSRSRNKHFGDEVKVWDERSKRWRRFQVAGVVRSPALDIAAGYFQLSSEYSVAASGSVMGSNKDLIRLFGIDGANLVLLNFDLPDEPVPPGWPPPPDSPEGVVLPERCYNSEVPLERRWRRWREAQVLREVRNEVGDPGMRVGTVADLKDEIDNQLTGVTGLLTAIPGVALLVAAVGVANLMTANVTARAKQLAILRAVGATRALVLRMVIGEALVLGLLGSALGLALGLHLAANITQLADRMWGFRVALELPWNYVITSVVLTVGLCIVAGILPARHAARANIVDALHVA
jgi:putative ABC transport system permease protein